MIRILGIVGLSFALLIESALAIELTSARFRLKGGHLNSGGVVFLEPAPGGAGIGSAGGTLAPGQPVGESTGTRSLAGGFWPIYRVSLDAGIPGDGDGDGVSDDSDNCVSVPNPTQSDSNADGFGNVCDADYDGDLIVGLADLGRLSADFGLTCSDPAFDPDLDANDDCSIGLSDYGALSTALGSPPGPSGLVCAGTVPCPAP